MLYFRVPAFTLLFEFNKVFKKIQHVIRELLRVLERERSFAVRLEEVDGSL